MPRWNTAELIDAPRFTKQSILAMIGPGLVMGASAIGGGEWLAGPAVTAKYGAALLWVATVSKPGPIIARRLCFVNLGASINSPVVQRGMTFEPGCGA